MTLPLGHTFGGVPMMPGLNRQNSILPCLSAIATAAVSALSAVGRFFSSISLFSSCRGGSEVSEATSATSDIVIVGSYQSEAADRSSSSSSQEKVNTRYSTSSEFPVSAIFPDGDIVLPVCPQESLEVAKPSSDNVVPPEGSYRRQFEAAQKRNAGRIENALIALPFDEAPASHDSDSCPEATLSATCSFPECPQVSSGKIHTDPKIQAIIVGWIKSHPNHPETAALIQAVLAANKLLKQ